jgi:hypothetical protein
MLSTEKEKAAMHKAQLTQLHISRGNNQTKNRLRQRVRFSIIVLIMTIVSSGCYPAIPSVSHSISNPIPSQLPTLVLPWGQFRRIRWNEDTSHFIVEKREYCIAGSYASVNVTFDLSYQKESLDYTLGFSFGGAAISGGIGLAVLGGLGQGGGDPLLIAGIITAGAGLAILLPGIIYAAHPTFKEKKVVHKKGIQIIKEPYACSNWKPIKNEPIILEVHGLKKTIKTNASGELSLSKDWFASVHFLNRVCEDSSRLNLTFANQGVEFEWSMPKQEHFSIYLKETDDKRNVELNHGQIKIKSPLRGKKVYWTENYRESTSNDKLDMSAPGTNTQPKKFSRQLISALDSCLKYRHPFFYAVRLNDISEIKQVCQKNPDQTKKKVANMTPLMFALFLKNKQATKTLLQCGATLTGNSYSQRRMLKKLLKGSQLKKIKKKVKDAKKVDNWAF